jgi:putative transposase
MLNQTEWERYCRTLGLSKSAVEYIETIRSSQPVRSVQSRKSNVCARYTSRKMGHTIQAESRTEELVAIRCAYEFEEQVLEFWDQPCRIPLRYVARNGRTVLVNHTPDFFVLRRDGAGWEEWKPLAQLEQQAVKMPHRYQQLPDGRWHCPPGEAYAAQYGLYYQLRTASEFPPDYQRNVEFLEDYFIDDGNPIEPATQQRLVDAVAEEPGITLAALKEHFSPDELFAAIARGIIYTDLEVVPLVDAERVMLFTSSQLARIIADLPRSHPARALARVEQLQAGTVIWWDERTWTIINMGVEQIALLPQEGHGRLVELSRGELERLVARERVTLPTPALHPTHVEALELLRQAGPKALERALQRATAVKALLAGQKPETEYAERTLREYKRRYLEAEKTMGSGFLGLLDASHLKGNREARFTPEEQALFRQFIDSYESPKQKSGMTVFGEYKRACEAQGFFGTSYPTFLDMLRQEPRRKQVRERQGSRAAYQTGPQFWALAYGTPRHGDYPWQYVHLDHTQLNVEVVCARTGRGLGRPWLTLLVDAYSRRILALYISFDAPGSRACMAILVECVRRHERLPQHLIVDRGAEFGSTYFETTLAYHNVTKLSRPPAEPRVGSVIERLFRTSETAFVHNLQGNTQITQKVRLMTKAVDPKRLAVWTLERLYDYFCQWSYEHYDTTNHSALGQSPREAYLEGLTALGERPSRRIVDDETFRILMLPTTQSGQAKVQPRGVQVYYLYYWSDTFRLPEVEGTTVPVRYDPFNAGVAYAYVNGLWERCLSEMYPDFQGRTRREMELATTALLQGKRQDGKKVTINAKMLANFLALIEEEEAILVQRLKDHAAQDVRASIFSAARPEVADAGLPAIGLAAPETESAPRRKQYRSDELGVYGGVNL